MFSIEEEASGTDAIRGLVDRVTGCCSRRRTPAARAPGTGRRGAASGASPRALPSLAKGAPQTGSPGDDRGGRRLVVYDVRACRRAGANPRSDLEALRGQSPSVETFAPSRRRSRHHPTPRRMLARPGDGSTYRRASPARRSPPPRRARPQARRRAGSPMDPGWRGRSHHACSARGKCDGHDAAAVGPEGSNPSRRGLGRSTGSWQIGCCAMDSAPHPLG